MKETVAKRTPAKVDLSWEEAIDLCEELARKIDAYCHRNQTGVDALVVLPRGGMVPGERVARLLGLDATRVLSASVVAYGVGQSTLSGQIKTGQLPTKKQVAGKRIWVIDEVCDTGVTLDFTTKLLGDYNPKELHAAVLHYKPAKSKTGFVPDLYLKETNEAWINYPWDEVVA